MFKISELLKCTSGKLIRGSSKGTVVSVSTDSRIVKKGGLFIAIKGDNFDGHDFVEEVAKKGIKAVIVHKRIKLPDKGVAVILVKDTVKALGDIARYNRRRFDIPVIAVTGSNGKTTTKDMIAWVLEGKFKVLKNQGTKNNHIGLPQTLLELNKTHDCAILEIGTNHFGEVRYLAKICEPNAAVITNIGPSHLEFLKDLEGVLREKYSLIDNLKRPRLAVFNSDDRLLFNKLNDEGEKVFGVGAGFTYEGDFRAGSVMVRRGWTDFVVNEKYKFTLNTPGSYNIHNAILAIAIGRIFGLDYKTIARRLRSFRFPKGRLNLIEVKGIRFIDDTYNSNPLSFKSAVETLRNFRAHGRKYMVMGDMLELGDGSATFHSSAVKLALDACDVLITVGSLSRQACKGIKAKNKKIYSCETSILARQLLLELSPKGEDVVLVKGSRGIKLEEVLKI